MIFLFNKLYRNYNLNELLDITYQFTRLRPTLPGSFPPSTIGAKELNFCVRNGNRCILLAIVTTYFEIVSNFKTKQHNMVKSSTY